jgi:spermidine synthase
MGEVYRVRDTKLGREVALKILPEAFASESDRMARFTCEALMLAVMMSGAASLIFEMVWFYRASLVLGNSVWAASIVLSSFMAGLGLGNFLAGWRSSSIKSPLRTYALLEVTVAVSGLAVSYALPELSGLAGRLTRLATSNAALLGLVRLAIAFTILGLPATAMGATLPVIIAVVWRTGHPLGNAFGRLYGWNTVGAVVGVLLAEVVVINAVGVGGAAWAAALLDLTAAGIALWVFRTRPGELAPPTEPQVARAAVSTHPWRLFACAALAGAAFMALEVIWFRFLSMFVLTTTMPMSLMLAVVLAGIGLGGLVASRLFRGGRAHMWNAVPVVAVLAGCAVAVGYRVFGGLTAGTQVGDWRQVVWMAVVLTGPTAFLSGALLTSIAESLNKQAVAIERTARLLLANTAGAMCGPLVAAFVLLPGLGMERALFALSASYLAICLLAPSERRAVPARARFSGPWMFSATVAVGVLALLTFPFGTMGRYFDRVVRPYEADGSAIVAAREGPTETILLMQRRWLNQPVYNRLVTNGFSMSGTAVAAQRYMRYFAYLPTMIHAAPLRRALLICYGVGVTASALTDIPALESIDIVETSADVVAMSDVIYSPTEHPLRDRRVRLHLDDGRSFLLTSSDKYDLITGEPPPPRTPGAVNIYTREFFQLVYHHLAEGGIATYWLPVARPDPGTDVDTIIRGFCAVFADCSLWNATPSDFMLLGTRHAAVPVPETNFSSAWHVPRLAANLREIAFEVPEQFGATFLGDAAYLGELVANTPPLTDDFPQRLRPVPGRPSLSDPTYAVDPATMRHYEGVLDPARAREAFARSDLIRTLWPSDLRERTLMFFEFQRITNRILWEGGQPLGQIEDLHALLTKTSFETLPLWLLGSDAGITRIAGTADESNPTAEYVRGLSALARRDYADAVSRLAHAEALGARVPTIRPLIVYALCLDARYETARQQANGVSPRTPDEQHFWTWIGSEFGVGPLSHAERR